MSTVQNPSYSQDEEAVLFFRRTKKDLGISSTKKVVRLVSHVLGHLRRGMSVQKTVLLLNRLPALFQLLLFKGWNGMATEEKAYSHLDELVDRVYEEDKQSAHSIFKSEVEALNAVLVILKKLDKYLANFSYEVFEKPLVEELRNVHLDGTFN